LLEHGAPPEHLPAGPPSLCVVLGLDRLDAFPQLREHLRLGSERGRDREPHLDLVGHGSVWRCGSRVLADNAIAFYRLAARSAR
jgi:hypothetical protein